MEVAPAELAPERFRPGSARQALLDLAHRQAAEVDVGREPRGPVGSECVVIVRVAGHVPAEEARQPLARPRLAAARRLLDLLLETERAERRESPPREPRRQGGKLRGAPIASRRGASSQRRWNGENTVYGRPAWVRSAARSSTAATPGCSTGATPWARSASDRLDPPPRERPHVGAEVHLVCADLAGEAASSCSAGPGGPRGHRRARRARRRGRPRQSSRNWVRGPEAWRPERSRSSKQKTGTTHLWPSSAARSAGWSWTRRSRVCQTSAVTSWVRAAGARRSVAADDAPERHGECGVLLVGAHGHANAGRRAEPGQLANENSLLVEQAPASPAPSPPGTSA